MADYHRSAKLQQHLQTALAYLFLALGSILMLAPIVWTVSTSLKEEGATQNVPPEWVPRIIVQVHTGGKLYQVMCDKNNSRNQYILVNKEKDGYLLQPIEPALSLSYFNLISASVDMTIEQVNEQSQNGKHFAIIQDYDRKEKDDFDMVVKKKILTVKPIDTLTLIAGVRKTPQELKYLKTVWFRWRNYREAWETIPFGRMYLNSIFISALLTLGMLFTSSLAAYSFARINFPGREKIFMMYLGTMMIPGMVTMIPNFIIIKNIGWLDTFYALIVPGIFSAWGVFMLRQFFQTIPKELEEAATIDGCSRFGIYWRIMLPLSGPALATLGTFTFIGTYNDFMGPLIYLKTESKMTLPIGLSYFQTQFGSQWALMMAAGMIVLAPMIIIYIFNQRFFVRGVAMTGLKG